MQTLKDCFICSPQPYQEGRVDVFRQSIIVKKGRKGHPYYYSPGRL